jgi:type I restriction enzyme S subunit
MTCVSTDSPTCGTHLNLVRGRAAQPHVNAEEIAALMMPLPDTAKQNELVAAMDAAWGARRAKLAQADALLAGLDGFLLDTLCLIPPPKDGRKVFAVGRVSVPARFDPHCNLPAFAQNLKMISDHGSQPRASITSFLDEIWKPERHDAPTFRYIEISNVNTNTGEARAEETLVAEAPSRARMLVREHDIIVSLTRPHHGAIAQITPDLAGCVASTGFSVLRGVNENGISRDYLRCVLRSQMCLAQMLQPASGGNYPAITEPELAKVLIPIPDVTVQERIAAEACHRREEVRRLRAEAEAAWDGQGLPIGLYLESRTLLWLDE